MERIQRLLDGGHFPFTSEEKVVLVDSLEIHLAGLTTPSWRTLTETFNVITDGRQCRAFELQQVVLDLQQQAEIERNTDYTTLTMAELRILELVERGRQLLDQAQTNICGPTSQVKTEASSTVTSSPAPVCSLQLKAEPSSTAASPLLMSPFAVKTEPSSRAASPLPISPFAVKTEASSAASSSLLDHSYAANASSDSNGWGFLKFPASPSSRHNISDLAVECNSDSDSDSDKTFVCNASPTVGYGDDTLDDVPVFAGTGDATRAIVIKPEVPSDDTMDDEVIPSSVSPPTLPVNCNAGMQQEEPLPDLVRRCFQSIVDTHNELRELLRTVGALLDRVGASAAPQQASGDKP